VSIGGEGVHDQFAKTAATAGYQNAQWHGRPF
jgi:hypothetical protein